MRDGGDPDSAAVSLGSESGFPSPDATESPMETTRMSLTLMYRVVDAVLPYSVVTVRVTS